MHAFYTKAYNYFYTIVVLTVSCAAGTQTKSLCYKYVRLILKFTISSIVSGYQLGGFPLN